MIKGIKVFKDTIFKDSRGLLWTSWETKLSKINFKHDKFSVSKKNVLRGLHYDNKTWKLISCAYGEFFFVIVNCNPKSEEYLKSYSTKLSAGENRSILVPPNFANGHLCLSRECVFHYKLAYKGKYSDVKNQKVLKWNDKRIKINWPIKKKLIMSERDR